MPTIPPTITKTVQLLGIRFSTAYKEAMIAKALEKCDVCKMSPSLRQIITKNNVCYQDATETIGVDVVRRFTYPGPKGPIIIDDVMHVTWDGIKIDKTLNIFNKGCNMDRYINSQKYIAAVNESRNKCIERLRDEIENQLMQLSNDAIVQTGKTVGTGAVGAGIIALGLGKCTSTAKASETFPFTCKWKESANGVEKKFDYHLDGKIYRFDKGIAGSRCPIGEIWIGEDGDYRLYKSTRYYQGWDTIPRWAPGELNGYWQHHEPKSEWKTIILPRDNEGQPMPVLTNWGGELFCAEPINSSFRDGLNDNIDTLLEGIGPIWSVLSAILNGLVYSGPQGAFWMAIDCASESVFGQTDYGT
jgi:hypothetical protein